MPEIAQTEHVSTLYRKYGATIYARCRRLTGDDQRAAEATVEAFTRAFPELINAKSEAEAVQIIYRACEPAPFLKCG